MFPAVEKIRCTSGPAGHDFPFYIDPHVARVLLNKVRLERMRQFGACYLGLELWKGSISIHFSGQVAQKDIHNPFGGVTIPEMR